MRVAWRAAAAVAAVALVAACGGDGEERRRAPSEPALRLWMPGIVRWEAGAPRAVVFAIENPTSRTVTAAAPDPANARVDVFAGPGAFRVCGVAPAAPPVLGPRVALAPGDRVAIRVDLEAACADVPAGEYRYEVSYRAAEPSGPDAVSGVLPTQYGQVLVAAAPPGEAVSRGDAERRPPAARPAARRGRASPARQAPRPEARAGPPGGREAR